MSSTITNSNHQRKPSVSNWFSSLRRQPKNKKSSTTNLTADDDTAINRNKKLQRSCVDLSSTTNESNSIFYTTISSDHYGGFGTGSKSIAAITVAATAAATTSSNEDYTDNVDDDRRGLLNGRNVRQLCSKCCCQLSSSPISTSSYSISTLSSSPKNLLKNHKKSTATTITGTAGSLNNNNDNDDDDDVNGVNDDENFYHETSSKTTATTTTTKQTSNSEIMMADPSSIISSKSSTNKNNKIKFMQFEKRYELNNTFCTTITRTTILTKKRQFIKNPLTNQNQNQNLINNRNGMIFDDSIINNDKDHNTNINSSGEKILKTNIRANSLDSILDCNDDDNGSNGGNINNGSSSNIINKKSSLKSKNISSLLDGSCCDLLYIDDSSSCPSETNDPTTIIKNINNINTNNNNNNNNNYKICNNCKIKSSNNYYKNDNNNSKSILWMNKKDDKFKNKKQIKDELCEVVSEMEALDSQEDCKHSNKDKQMSIGRKKFNMDPKKGIEYLVDNHLLRMDPQDIAHFLYKGEGLNKTAIGDYLGEKNDFNEQVLKAFVELHDFTNLILVQALRQFLWSFRLPGEAQKIDRMMECFAQRYCQLNPDIFTNTDTCYVLSFAIIMLNTSLHNPSVKDKPTVEQFISMNRGINNGGDLPRGLLESLYESIRTEPFKIPQDDGNDLMHTFFNPDKEGWLWKQGGRYKSWKRRWFILNDNCLYYFEYTTDKEPRGIIPLENISVREIQDRNKPHCFELYACGGADIIKACKTDSEGKVVEGKHTVYRMSAATEEDKQEWIKRLTQSISHNPFYDILVQRKKKALAKS